MDVAVAGHVLYNVADLEPFVGAIAGVAQGRVVFELTDRHPLAWMNDLWLRFHSVERPAGPTCDDALDALIGIGLDPRIDRWEAPPRGGGFARRAEDRARRRAPHHGKREGRGVVARARGHRLAEREGLWSVGPPRQALASIWFDPEPRSRIVVADA